MIMPTVKRLSLVAIETILERHDITWFYDDNRRLFAIDYYHTVDNGDTSEAVDVTDITLDRLKVWLGY